MIQTRSIINTPVRSISAKVELYNGSTLATTYNHTDAIASIDIERVGEESKFFGFGISQKLNVKLIDVPRAIDISTANSFKVYFNEHNVYPIFNVTEVNRAENTN